jgi:exonuclease III
VCCGDFNAVLDPSERRSGVGPLVIRVDREMREFIEFISLMNLIDLPLLWRRFTWVQPYSGAASRLDRFLVSNGWLDAWGNVSQWALPRDVSDHCPIVLRYLAQLWGPKPFRFNNFWLDHKTLSSVVQHNWRQELPPG